MNRRTIVAVALVPLMLVSSIAFAQDPTAPPWVAQWGGYITNWIMSMLNTAMPGLDPGFAKGLAQLVAAGVTVGLVWLYEHVIGAKHVAERAAAGVPSSNIGTLWYRWSGVLNPVLALILGWITGGGTVGVLAAGARSMGKAITAAPTRARNLKPIVGCFLALSLFAGLAHAQSIATFAAARDPEIASFSQRISPSFGVIARKPTGRDLEPAVVAQLAWAWTAHIAPRARFVVPLRRERDAEVEAGLFIYF